MLVGISLPEVGYSRFSHESKRFFQNSMSMIHLYYSINNRLGESTLIINIGSLITQFVSRKVWRAIQNHQVICLAAYLCYYTHCQTEMTEL